MLVLANTVYSGVPSHVFWTGADYRYRADERKVECCCSGWSGAAFRRRTNWSTAFYQRAKGSDHTLSDAEMVECLPAAVSKQG